MSTPIIIKREISNHIQFLNSDFLLSAPKAPENLSGVEILSLTSLSLNWDDVVSKDSYTVYVYNNTQNQLEQTITDVSASEATITSLTSDEEYEFWVVSVRDNIESSESNHVTETISSIGFFENSIAGGNDTVFLVDNGVIMGGDNQGSNFVDVYNDIRLTQLNYSFSNSVSTTSYEVELRANDGSTVLIYGSGVLNPGTNNVDETVTLNTVLSDIITIADIDLISVGFSQNGFPSDSYAKLSFDIL